MGGLCNRGKTPQENRHHLVVALWVWGRPPHRATRIGDQDGHNRNKGDDPSTGEQVLQIRSRDSGLRGAIRRFEREACVRQDPRRTASQSGVFPALCNCNEHPETG